MDKEKQARLNFLQNDPDTGLIQQGHVCKHGVRWPHECRECVDAAWERHKLEEELKMKENIEFNGSEKIDNAAGDYIVLTDHGMEGISVSYQTDTPPRCNKLDYRP